MRKPIIAVFLALAAVCSVFLILENDWMWSSSGSIATRLRVSALHNSLWNSSSLAGWYGADLPRLPWHQEAGERPAQPQLNASEEFGAWDSGWKRRGLCPAAEGDSALPACTSVAHASRAGLWVRSPQFYNSKVLGVYSDWCWKPLTCRLAPLPLADVSGRCRLHGKYIAVYGDSNAGHMFNAIVGGLGLPPVEVSVTSGERNQSVGADYLRIPRGDILANEDGHARRHSDPQRGTIVEHVRYLFANDTRVVGRGAASTIATIKQYHWPRLGRTPDVILFVIGMHDTKLLYPLDVQHVFLPRVYPVDPVSGHSSYPAHLNTLMNELAPAPNVIWSRVSAIDFTMQESPYRYTTSNRRVMQINAWGTALAEHHGYDVLHADAMSTSEMPELHNDGMHLHAYHDAYYNAIRDILLALLC